jgi:predicted nuclease with RNAse H fold
MTKNGDDARMLTAGIDLASQPAKTGAVVIDWSEPAPILVQAMRGVDDAEVAAVCAAVKKGGGKVGIDCPLGWPQAFVDFVSAHAAQRPLPDPLPSSAELRLRVTDLVQVAAGRRPLSVSTDKLGSTALRAARILEAVAATHGPDASDRVGGGLIVEVYPAASRHAWRLSPTQRDVEPLIEPLGVQLAPPLVGELSNEHVFDALVAALTARAVVLGQTVGPEQHQIRAAQVEGWIHAPTPGHQLSDLQGRG